MHRPVAGDEPALLGDQLARGAVPVRQRFLDLVGDAGAQHGEVALGEILALRRRRNRGRSRPDACSLEMPVRSVQALLTNSKVRSSDLT